MFMRCRKCLVKRRTLSCNSHGRSVRIRILPYISSSAFACRLGRHKLSTFIQSLNVSFFRLQSAEMEVIASSILQPIETLLINSLPTIPISRLVNEILHLSSMLILSQLDALCPFGVLALSL